jgi:hypothetical protein
MWGRNIFCPTFFCQQRAWRAARIQLIVRGRRLVHSMLLTIGPLSVTWRGKNGQREPRLIPGKPIDMSVSQQEY